ncbi:MAG: L-threonylcarbamoyladenylate synthase [Alphaproteobacteria bacterium]|nr:L-threonylcarbamoyladenylate synthase [Alphaproteobacteria bacterium]
MKNIHTAGRSKIASASAEAILDGAARLRAGELVAFPTETVYGLGADANDDRAVTSVFAAKRRPEFNPLIVHVPGIAEVSELVRFDGRAEACAREFWPGPLTLVLPRAGGCKVSRLASAGLDTLALRVPGHTLAHALLCAAGRPIVAPSANRSGAISPTEARHVRASLGETVDLVLDGGRCPVGIESSVLDLSGDVPVLLRPGAVPVESIEAVVGPLAQTEGDMATGSDPRRSPGLLQYHYAPSLPLRLGAENPRVGEVLLAFGPDAPDGFAFSLNLSPSGDLREAAGNFFAMLHQLDISEFTGIAAMEVPEEGLGRAINDRLRRAAGAKP